MIINWIRRRLTNTCNLAKGVMLAKKYTRFTMIPTAIYAKNIAIAMLAVRVRGCVVECGTWKGGMLAGLADTLGKDRRYIGFDSFEGLPNAKPIDGDEAIAWQLNTSGKDYHNNCSAAKEEAEEALRISGSQSTELIAGWFADTVVNWQANEPIAFLRLDGDWYDSTMTCLNHLVPQMSEGGIIVIDDYYTWGGCSKAVHDWLSLKKLPLCKRQGFNDVCYLVVSDEALALLTAESLSRTSSNIDTETPLGRST